MKMRLDFSQTFWRAAKYLLILYAIVSLVFTARHFYTSHGPERTLLTEDAIPIYPRADDDELVIPRPAVVDHQASTPAPPIDNIPKKHTVVWTDEKGECFAAVSLDMWAS